MVYFSKFKLFSNKSAEFVLFYLIVMSNFK